MSPLTLIRVRPSKAGVCPACGTPRTPDRKRLVGATERVIADRVAGKHRPARKTSSRGHR